MAISYSPPSNTDTTAPRHHQDRPQDKHTTNHNPNPKGQNGKDINPSPTNNHPPPISHPPRTKPNPINSNPPILTRLPPQTYPIPTPTLNAYDTLELHLRKVLHTLSIHRKRQSGPTLSDGKEISIHRAKKLIDARKGPGSSNVEFKLARDEIADRDLFVAWDSGKEALEAVNVRSEERMGLSAGTFKQFRKVDRG